MGITREEQQTGDIQKNTNRASGENQTKVIGVVFHKTFAKPRLNPHETGYLEQPQIRGLDPAEYRRRCRGKTYQRRINVKREKSPL
ncbi:MAG: hypothetical protein IKE69_08965 [Thermoguttaceae bacterium]|nr:hypothetical protein [Thermoguttaceae bacterium]